MKLQLVLLCSAVLLGGCSTSRTSVPAPANAPNNASLENTYWKLMTLGGAAVATPEGAREIQFVLHPDDHRLSGFSGCNSMMGAYQVQNDKLTFSNLGGTRMFCEKTMDIETRVHQMFSNVATWKIVGESLQLSDARGTALATFESRYMK